MDDALSSGLLANRNEFGLLPSGLWIKTLQGELKTWEGHESHIRTVVINVVGRRKRLLQLALESATVSTAITGKALAIVSAAR